VRAQLSHHVETAVLVQQEVLEDHRSDEVFDLALDNHVVDDGVHEGEPLTGEMVAVLHSNENVSTRPENPHQLRQGGGINLTWSKPIGGHDDVIALIIDRNGPKSLHPAVDVVLEDPLGPGLTQHTQGGVQSVNVAVTMPTNLGPSSPVPAAKSRTLT